MFEYKMLYEVSCYDLTSSNIADDERYCLLIPELIENIDHKINNYSIKIEESDYIENGYFNNGYSIFFKNDYILKIIREDGTFIENLPALIKPLYNKFCEDRLLVTIEGKEAYIDGISGEILPMPEEYSTLFEYHCGYAVVANDIDGSCYYMDKDLTILPNKYYAASPFAFDKALVCTDSEWQIIDTSFNVILSFPRSERKDQFFKIIIDQIENEANNEAHRDSNVIRKLGKWPKEIIYLNIDTNLSIFAPNIIKNIAQKLDLVLPTDLDFKNQLVWLVNEVSKKGIYVYDLKERKIVEVELEKGIEISNRSGRLISYDEEDIEFLRQRIKKESLNE